jgi:hypothetical protein
VYRLQILFHVLNTSTTNTVCPQSSSTLLIRIGQDTCTLLRLVKLSKFIDPSKDGVSVHYCLVHLVGKMAIVHERACCIGWTTRTCCGSMLACKRTPNYPATTSRSPSLGFTITDVIAGQVDCQTSSCGVMSRALFTDHQFDGWRSISRMQSWLLVLRCSSERGELVHRLDVVPTTKGDHTEVYSGQLQTISL